VKCPKVFHLELRQMPQALRNVWGTILIQTTVVRISCGLCFDNLLVLMLAESVIIIGTSWVVAMKLLVN